MTVLPKSEKMYTLLNLVRVTADSEHQETGFYAVDDDTLENMYDTSSAMTHIVGDGPGDYSKKQFQVDKIGDVWVPLEQTGQQPNIDQSGLPGKQVAVTGLSV